MDKSQVMNRAEAIKSASAFLQAHQKDGSLARTYWLAFKDESLTDFVLKQGEVLPLEEWENFQALLGRIVQDEPLQYILGQAYFNERSYKVTPDTLIPREETQGIIDWSQRLLEKRGAPRKILDIGTGSGILPIELKLLYPQAQVWAVDLSQAALAIAAENVAAHEVEVHFVHSDLLDQIPSRERFDLIVSNPPYIAADELEVMDASVKKYEPDLALYGGVDGLAIYQRLSQVLPSYLAAGGLVVLEMGYRQGPALLAIFQATFPQALVRVEKDFNGLDRYLIIEERGLEDGDSALING